MLTILPRCIRKSFAVFNLAPSTVLFGSNDSISMHSSSIILALPSLNYKQKALGGYYTTNSIIVTDNRNFSALIASYLSRYSSIPILPLPKEYFAKYTTMPYISDRNIPRILTFPGVNIPITANTFLHKLSFLSASETD